ncbi:hypothetical protein P171DRAFT_426103 [Karstenula rhodostoma CBS 690.94]|uniref:Uncharacterized protein n=1 Tax=Karstenula rhodostoma CBS 690.94 TaxID=1392251 RepID=A0A9P4PYM5_9PLEO|nr:hypothetical protein P171DRAFT_426103 [Karstenula rhodostoma CBS 690.94]
MDVAGVFAPLWSLSVPSQCGKRARRGLTSHVTIVSTCSLASTATLTYLWKAFTWTTSVDRWHNTARLKRYNLRAAFLLGHCGVDVCLLTGSCARFDGPTEPAMPSTDIINTLKSSGSG